MKLYNIINAYTAMQKIAKYPLPKQTLYHVRKILLQAEENIKFYLEQSSKCADHTQKAELLEVEVDMPPAISFEMPEELLLSVVEIESLRGMIDLEFKDIEKLESEVS